MRQPVTAEKALCQLPWLHSAAIMQPSVMCTASSAALLKLSTTASYNKKHLTHKEPPLLHWRVVSVEDTLQFTWWVTAAGAVWLKQLPTSTQNARPSVNICPARTECRRRTYGPHTGFYNAARSNLLMPTPPVVLGKLGSRHLALHLLCVK